MLITIERPACCLMFARSCKHYKLHHCIRGSHSWLFYRVFTRSSKHRADVNQTSSKRRANIELAQAGLLEPRSWLKCRPRLRLLAHSWSRVT